MIISSDEIIVNHPSMYALFFPSFGLIFSGFIKSDADIAFVVGG